MGNGPRYYRLIGKLAVPEPNMLLWCSKFEDIDARRVAVTRVGSVEVCTVFNGIDHGYTDDGVPQIFETKVIRNGVSCECERCDTWQAAEEQHRRVVDEIRKEVLPIDPPHLVQGGKDDRH